MDAPSMDEAARVQVLQPFFAGLCAAGWSPDQVRLFLAQVLAQEGGGADELLAQQ